MIISYIYTNQKTKDKVKSLVNNNLTNSPIFKENLNHIFFNNIKDLFNNIINSKINILVLGVDKEQEKEIINKLKNIYKYNSNEDKIILHTNTKQIEDYGLKNIIHVDKNNYDDLIYFINVNIAEQEMFSPKGKYSILHMKTSFEREIAKLEQQSRLSFKEKQKLNTLKQIKKISFILKNKSDSFSKKDLNYFVESLMKYEKKLNILNNGSDESIKNLFEKEYKEFLEKERRDIAKHEKNLIFRKKK